VDELSARASGAPSPAEADEPDTEQGDDSEPAEREGQRHPE
jgi:hypothetical protein